jgi:TolB protein
MITGCGLFGGAGEDTTSPEPPTGLSAVSQDAAIALDWGAVQADDLAGYNVYRSTSTIGDVSNLDPVNASAPVTGASYTDDTAGNGTRYRYVVTAIDKAGNESEPSGEIEKTPFAAPPDRP